MIRVMHKKCGKIAFYLKEKVERGGHMSASNVVLLDGNSPTPHSLIQCGSCLEAITNGNIWQLEQQHWTDWFIPNKDDIYE